MNIPVAVLVYRCEPCKNIKEKYKAPYYGLEQNGFCFEACIK